MMSTSDASVMIGHVTLVVRDLAGMAEFYKRVIGLEPIAQDATEVSLGAGGKVLVVLRRDTGARMSTPRDTGLYHTAFLLPSRPDLGAWLHHVVEARQPMQGASDHLVSEALYLADPEGNGIEVYIDRPRADWSYKGREVKMATDPLDLQSLGASARGRWTGAPEGTVVGHVHLQVGALDPAEKFYKGVLGAEIMAHYPGAHFHGWDGYHHHLATNIWHSRNAAPKSGPVTGLAEVGLLGTPEALKALRTRADARSNGLLVDPWGLEFSLSEKEMAHAG